jgi:SAM-dependent methyltransferase
MRKLTKPLPANRSIEQVENHYLVEKSIAERLKKSTRAERKVLYATMYDELFTKVPDHPRLTHRQSAQSEAKANINKFALLRKFLRASDTVLEFGPGDCRLGFEVAKHVKRVYGVDLSDQRNPTDIVPDNFHLVVYDGYDLDQIESNSVDLVFSDQLIEHIHPEDIKLHFESVRRMLKPSGKYIFRTPHFLTGPHDVSQYFSYEPECFHLKEWTYAEIKTVLMDSGYSKFQTYWCAKGLNLRMPYSYFALCESVIGKIPKKYIRRATKYLIPHLCGVAIK